MLSREKILRYLNAMKPGQSVKIARGDFDLAFRVGLFNSHARTPEDVCYNGLIGSNRGTFEIVRDAEHGDVTVHRREESDRRVRVDVDREHLFEKDADGFYVPRRAENPNETGKD